MRDFACLRDALREQCQRMMWVTDSAREPFGQKQVLK